MNKDAKNKTNSYNISKLNTIPINKILKVSFLVDGNLFSEFIDTRESIKNFAYKLSTKYPISLNNILDNFMSKFEDPIYLINLIKCNSKGIEQDYKELISLKSNKYRKSKSKSNSKSPKGSPKNPKRKNSSPFRKESQKSVKSRDSNKSLKKSKSQASLTTNDKYKGLSDTKRAKAEKVILTQKEKDEEEFKKCTFTPDIGINSRKMRFVSKNISTNVHKIIKLVSRRAIQ